MALKTKSPGRVWSRIHFLVRFLGLTGFLAAGVGVALAYLNDTLERIVTPDAVTSWEKAQAWWAYVYPNILGEAGAMAQWATSLLVGGALLAMLALLLEILVGLASMTGRRSAFGLNAAVQVALAVVLLVGVNWFSYRHYQRRDWTRDGDFTLPAKVQQELGQLKSPTTIVVYLPHKSPSLLEDKSDPKSKRYVSAAERKVVEKVEDLADQFRAFGPQFRVVVLDVQEEGYEQKLEDVTRDHKELSDALEGVPENSIFFVADGKVERLSFSEFYRLDLDASRKANDGKGNLVLLTHGVEPFARKVMNLDEKRPKVGVLVIHEVLTTQGADDYGLAGLKKTLTARGYDVQDVILKKWTGMGPPEPAVLTYEENKAEALEEQLSDVEANLKNLEQGLKELTEEKKYFETTKLEELTKKFKAELDRNGIPRFTEAMRRATLERQIEPQLAIVRLLLKQNQQDRTDIRKEMAGVDMDRAGEERRMTDLKAKLERTLADCDLLIVPRMTLRNIVLGDRISNRFYRLDEAQVAAVKDFLAAGKPVLACFGPANEPPTDAMRMGQLGSAGPDELENLLGKVGIKFGNQTILYNAESKSFAERRSGLVIGGAVADVPPVEFDQVPPPPGLAGRDASPVIPNPIRTGMLIAARGRGEKTLDLRIRHPRPVYFERPGGKRPEVEPEFLMSNAASWNEDQPFPSRERTPRFETPKPDDPTKGTLDEKRRGPFPIGVAVETQAPADWYTDKAVKPATVRVAAIGSGGVFVGAKLEPPQEELLLDTCNWLLGRDDLLPRSDRTWSYPRVVLADKEQTVWRWGTWVGLPALFAYFGLVVLMVRRLR
jgi:hypothetical protein